MVTEFSAACESCDWRAQTQDPHSQVLASFDAKRHVNATGHEVVWREVTVRSGRHVRSDADVRLEEVLRQIRPETPRTITAVPDRGVALLHGEPLRVEDGIGDTTPPTGGQA